MARLRGPTPSAGEGGRSGRAEIAARGDDEDRREPAAGVGDDERGGGEAERHGGKGGGLDREGEAEGEEAVGAYAAVAHDLQRAGGLGGAHAVEGVGEAVLVQRAGQGDGGGEGEEDGDGERQGVRCGEKDAGAERADEPADERIVARGGGEEPR